MARNLIGTGADQVSVNGMLGELAFQSKENINFTGGTGKLSKLDIEAISAQLGVTANDVFVYDTSKDSDGGAWRKRCQNTAWYNEALNTSTRGSRKEFPSVAVLVINTSQLIIYDGDSPDLPMWATYNLGWDQNYRGVWALNGIIAIANRSGFMYSGNGLHLLYFIADKFVSSVEITTYSGQASGTKSGIATTSGFRYPSEGMDGIRPFTLVSYMVNDVAMTVLPNAPIDVMTNLPIPTIAVATYAGVSVIKHDGVVVNITCNNANYTQSRKVTFLADNALGLSLEANSPSSEDSFYVFNQVPQQSTVISVDTKSGSPISADAFYSAQLVNTSNVNLFLNGLDSNRVINKAERLNFGTPFGLTQIAENRSNPSAGMTAFIARKYNTGWMHGNIKGAWLSDTTQETINSSELVTNGTFTTNTAGWSNEDVTTFTVNAGRASLYSGGGNLRVLQTVSGLAVGKTYTLSMDIQGSANAYLSTTANSAGSVGEVGYANWAANSSAQVTWTATQSSINIILYVIGTGNTAYFDNVSLRLADADRSVNNKGLQVFGSIAKAPVAAGADLVAYSGFSANNYLQQPYNSSMDVGTGDFCFTEWLYCTDTSGYNMAHDRTNAAGTGVQIAFLIFGGQYRAITGSVSRVFGSFPTNTWTHIAHVRRNGVQYLYSNGILLDTAVATDNVSGSDYVQCIGNAAASGGKSSQYFKGSIALSRFSATAPSPEQILKMYNDEKVLFQDNAKATLYGSSDSITALAYDEDTQLLHVGTSSGRSVFQGLRRIDNTTTAVSASISASNGLVAEQ